MTERISIKVDAGDLAAKLDAFGPGAKVALRKAMNKVGTTGRKTMRDLEPVRTDFTRGDAYPPAGELRRATKKKGKSFAGGLGNLQTIYIGDSLSAPTMRDKGGVHTPALYGIFQDQGTVKNRAHHFSELTAGYLDAAAPGLLDQAIDDLISTLDLD